MWSRPMGSSPRSARRSRPTWWPCEPSPAAALAGRASRPRRDRCACRPWGPHRRSGLRRGAGAAYRDRGAVKALPRELLKNEPGLPWAEIARMRDQLAHRYFDTTHAIVASTVTHDLPQLRQAVARLLDVTGND